jgi:hypothetical protein
MALITLQPSTDIHLVLAPAAQASLALDILSHDPAATAPTSVRPQCGFVVAAPAIATVSTAGVLTAKAVGRTFLTVTYTPASGPALTVVARVWVHAEISDWWFGANHGSVHAGEADLLLPIFAVFQGGDIGDITGHGYVALSATGAGATVAADGRVSGVSEGDVTVKGTLVGRDHTVVVTVTPAVSTIRLIVEPVRFSGPIDQRRNVLFLAEGFTDQSKFSSLVQKVVDRLVSSGLHHPFKMLRDDINFWMAFEPSQENGITVGPPINSDRSMLMNNFAPATTGDFSFYQFVSLVGLPDATLVDADRADVDTRLAAAFPTYQPAHLETPMFEYWQTWTSELLQTRNSRYGFMYGMRPGEHRFSADPKTADNAWNLLPLPPHYLAADPRRSPANLARWPDLHFQFLNSLRTKKGASDPSFNIGPKWNHDAEDQGLVVILCNDEAYGAFTVGQGYSAVTIDHKGFFSKTSSPGGLVLDHDPDTSGATLEALVAVVAHELGHQFFLGDEYEGDASRTTVATAADLAEVDVCDNLTTAQLLLPTPTSTIPDVNRIKWNRLFRVTRASRLASAAVNAASGGLDLPLAAGEGARWKVGDAIAVRTRNLNPAPLQAAYPIFRRHPFKQRVATVTAIAADVVTVSGGGLAAGEAYPAGSTLFIAKLNKAGTAPLTLTLPPVVTFMHGPPFQPLAAKTQCDTAITTLVLPPTIPGITLTSDDRPRVIGLYEGGGRWNCGVFRPAPVCKMRDHIWPPPLAAPDTTQRRHFRFCFVCRYSIVNEINPRRHTDLDAFYPGHET